jgi:hypothetical protein
VIGFDIERHVYDGMPEYPAQLVLQDVLTIHGSQFKDAALIVASPPCQEYSYMAMPWSRAKQIRREYLDGTRDRKQLTALFDACFRIQREASEAAGRHIPMVVENVRGAQEWVGRSRWNFGSFHLWGDVPALMPKPLNLGRKHHGDCFNDPTWPGKQGGVKTVGHVNQRDGHSHTRHLTNQSESEGVKQHGSGREWFAGDGKISRLTSSKSTSRKAASAAIAKIPLVLARHIAKSWYPEVHHG